MAQTLHINKEGKYSTFCGYGYEGGMPFTTYVSMLFTEFENLHKSNDIDVDACNLCVDIASEYLITARRLRPNEQYAG